ncbi:bursicon-like [Mercenaria mercenaria]|uniref:bursicon-like n=1 Tax=Mercenaria mercenaria TaxID=6596 RepID=UPI001E1D5C97|nr:bursicon-like [Mercenaria mercenaria]
MWACFFLMGIVILSSVQSLSTDIKSNCSMRYVQMRIKFQNCLPVRVLAQACHGSCVSYTATSSIDPKKLETKCECCQYVGRKRKRFGIKCPHKQYKNVYKIRVASIAVPKRCMCRPCSAAPNRLLSAERAIFMQNPMLDLLRIRTLFH